MAVSLDFSGGKGIHFVHFNCRSLSGCIKSLREYIENSNIDCVTLSETWLTEESDSGLLTIEGYTLVRQDRAI